MDVLHSLNLRKPDNANRSQMKNNSQDNRRQKNSNMQEILVRNFFRKYPTDKDTGDKDRLLLEKTVKAAMQAFITKSSDVSSKNLAQFEIQLASKMSLARREIEHSYMETPKSNTLVGTLTNPVTPGAMRDNFVNRANNHSALGAHSKNRSQIGLNDPSQQQFQLPIIRKRVHPTTTNINVQRMPMRNKSQITMSGGHRNLVRGGTEDSHMKNYNNMLNVNAASQIIDKNKYNGNRLNNNAVNSYVDQPQKLRQFRNRQTNGQHRSTTSVNSNRLSQTRVSSREPPMKTGGLISPFENNRTENTKTPTIENGNSLISQSAHQNFFNVNMKKKLLKGQVREEKIQDLPSDISDDEWGEIQKYSKVLHEESQKKERHDHVAKAQHVKEILDQQVKHRDELRLKNKEERRAFDKKIIAQAHKEEEDERKQKQQKVQKVFEQKAMRDQMLREAKAQRKQVEKKMKDDERNQVVKLQEEIVTEKEQKLFKKVKEREQALKVIHENEVEKANRVKQKKVGKDNDAKAIQYEIKAMEAREKKRLSEIAAREEKVARIMNRMEDVIVHKDKDMQRQQEKEYIAKCIEKDEEAAKQDFNKKLQVRAKHEQVRQFLEKQVEEKRRMKELDENTAQVFRHNLKAAVQEEEEERLMKSLSKHEQVKANQAYLQKQMVEHPTDGIRKGSEKSKNKKYLLGGQMRPDEARMNRELLKEISAKKKNTPVKNFDSNYSSP